MSSNTTWRRSIVMGTTERIVTYLAVSIILASVLRVIAGPAFNAVNAGSMYADAKLGGARTAGDMIAPTLLASRAWGLHPN
jgi:hypothetical protein